MVKLNSFDEVWYLVAQKRLPCVVAQDELLLNLVLIDFEHCFWLKIGR